MPELANPTVALGIQTAQSPGANPLGLIGTIANAQKSLIEARMAGQQLAARQRAGQIMAQAPDLESGTKALLADPLTAGFAPEVATSVAATNQTLTNTQGLVLDQSLSGMQKVLGALAAGVNDPTMGMKNARAILSTLPPSAQPMAEKALTATEQAIYGSLSELPPEQRASAAAKNFAAIATTMGGVAPDTIRAMTGNPAPSITMAPVGPGGAPVPIQTGGPAAGSGAGAQIVGQPSAPVKGLTPEQVTESSGKGAVSADLAKDMSDTAANVPRDVQKVNALQDAMSKFQSGGGAAFRTQIGQTMQALKNAGFTGIDQAAIDKVANGSLRGSEFFNSIIKPQMVSLIADVQRGSGVKSTANELNAYLDSLDIDTDPGTINDFLNLLKKNLQFAYDRSQHYADFVQERQEGKHNVPDYVFNQYYNKHFGSELPTTTGGGVDIGPRADSAVKGATGEPTVAGPKNLDSLRELFGVKK